MHLRVPLIVVTLCSLISAAVAAADKYARPHLLIETNELAKPDVARRLVILDARKKVAYQQSHIPGARWVDHDTWKSALGDGTDVQGWSRRIGTLGIDRESEVVVYDDMGGLLAARIWWLLRYWGVDGARLLNGGWRAWQAEGLPTDAVEPPPVRATQFTANAHRQRLATKEQIVASLPEHRLQLVDSRSREEYCGIDRKENKRGGAIPGARHLEWSNLLDPATGRFKSPEELRRLIAEAGIDLNAPLASYCQTGGRASVMAFGLELMGAKESRNYYSSWSEWGNNEDLPIVVPEKK